MKRKSVRRREKERQRGFEKRNREGYEKGIKLGD